MPATGARLLVITHMFKSSVGGWLLAPGPKTPEGWPVYRVHASLPFSFCFSAARRWEPSRAQTHLPTGNPERPRLAIAAPPKNKEKVLVARRAINSPPLRGLTAARSTA